MTQETMWLAVNFLEAGGGNLITFISSCRKDCCMFFPDYWWKFFLTYKE